MKEYNVLSVVMTGVNNDEVYSVTTDIEVNELLTAHHIAERQLFELKSAFLRR